MKNDDELDKNFTDRQLQDLANGLGDPSMAFGTEEREALAEALETMLDRLYPTKSLKEGLGAVLNGDDVQYSFGPIGEREYIDYYEDGDELTISGTTNAETTVSNVSDVSNADKKSADKNK